MKTSQPQTSLDERFDLQQVSRGEFIGALAHLYRGELGEATAWRSRIDSTTHWAVVLSATALSFIFSESSGERHVLIPIVSFFITFLMLMEARRYRFYDIWRSRARMIEINFYRPLLEGCEPAMANWATVLGEDLTWPRFHMPWWEAAGRRLRRNYQWIYAILLGSWLLLLMSYPHTASSLSEMIARAAVGPLPGWLVMVGMVLFHLALLTLGLYSFYASRLREGLPAGHPGRMGVDYSHDP